MNGLIVVGIVVILVVFALVMVYVPRSETFSPTGWTVGCPPPSRVRFVKGKSPDVFSGPLAVPLTGPLARRWNRDTHGFKPSFKITKGTFAGQVPGRYRKNVKSRPKGRPKVRNNLPLGWGSTMSGPYAGPAGCSGNVNGVTRMSYSTPYGETFPFGGQMYGFCESTPSNPFNETCYTF